MNVMNLTPKEKEIIEIIENEKDYEKVIKEKKDIEIMKALSSVRENIISWYPFKKNATILEVGANFGEITGALCKKAKKVVAIEESEHKAKAIEKRHSDLKNLEIITGRLDEIELKNKFDYIILFGTLENKNKNYKDILKKAKQLLAEKGTILIAIDNQLGLKYLTKLDETGVTTTNPGEKKFIKLKQLCEELKKQDYGSIKYYYPLPDYKFTNVIYTEERFISKNDISRNIVYNDEDTIFLCDENSLYRELLDTNKDIAKYFFNSYLLEVSKEEKNDIKFVSFSNMRKPQYRVKTIMKEGKVYKYPIDKNSANHIKETKENIDIMKSAKLKTLDTYDEDKIISNFSSESTLDEVIIKLIKQNKKDKAIELIKIFKNEIINKLEKGTEENNVFEKYNIEVDKNILENMYFIKEGLWDLNFQNCFYINNEFYFYDQEWREKNVPINFILYRAINYFGRLKKYIPDEKMYELLKITKEEIEIFEKLDNKIQEEIREKTFWKLNKQGKSLQDFKLKVLTNNHENNLLIIEKSKEINKLKGELQAIYNSKSWKLIQKAKRIMGKKVDRKE